MTEVVDDFIGQKFGNGGHLEVIDWSGERNRSGKIYLLYCSVCALDKEVFGDGIFKSTKNNLVGGRIPCGCSKRHSYSKEQLEVKILRKCTEQGYKFSGFIGEWSGITTKIQLNRLRDDLLLEIKILSFLSDTTDYSYTGSGRAKSADVMVDSFLASGGFSKSTVFYQSDRVTKRGYRHWWYHSCDICSNDEYVVGGACSGLFEVHQSRLQRGYKGCRCSTHHHWTQAEREFQIKHIIDVEKLRYTFLGWPEIYSDGTSKFRSYCEDHGCFTTSVSSFVNHGSRCPSCAITGFDSSREGYVYVLKVSGTNNFTGFGITSHITRRMANHKKNIENSGSEILSSDVFEMSGHQARNIEKAIKDKFPRDSQPISGFVVEATHFNLHSDVIDFVKSNLETPPMLH